MSLGPPFRIAAVVTAIVVTAMAFGGLYLLGEAQENETAKLERAVTQAWEVSRTASKGSTLEDLVAVARRMVEKTDVQGARLLDSTGREVATVGEIARPPRHGPTIRERLFGGQVERFEIHDAAHDITLHVDASERSATLRRAVGSVSGLTMLIASLIAIACVWLLDGWVSRPQRAIADMLEAPTHEGVAAIGQMRAGDANIARLASGASDLARRFLELADAGVRRSQALIEHYPHPIMIFTLEGDLSEANRSALSLFAAETLERLEEKMPISRLRLQDGTPLETILATGARIGLATARTPRGDIPCLLACDRLRDPEGGDDRFVVTFVDLRATSPDIGGTGDVRTGRLTANLEACHILLQAMSDDAGDDEDEMPVELSALVDGWQEKSAARGLIGKFTRSSLPVVAGRQIYIERILASALHVVRGRSVSLKPDISLEGKPSGDGMAITISERGDATVAAGADVSVAMAALVRLLARQEGTLVQTAGVGEPNRLSIQLAVMPMPSDSMISRAA